MSFCPAHTPYKTCAGTCNSFSFRTDPSVIVRLPSAHEGITTRVHAQGFSQADSSLSVKRRRCSEVSAEENDWQYWRKFSYSTLVEPLKKMGTESSNERSRSELNLLQISPNLPRSSLPCYLCKFQDKRGDSDCPEEQMLTRKMKKTLITERDVALMSLHGPLNVMNSCIGEETRKTKGRFLFDSVAISSGELLVSRPLVAPFKIEPTDSALLISANGDDDDNEKDSVIDLSLSSLKRNGIDSIDISVGATLVFPKDPHVGDCSKDSSRRNRSVESLEDILRESSMPEKGGRLATRRSSVIVGRRATARRL